MGLASPLKSRDFDCNTALSKHPARPEPRFLSQGLNVKLMERGCLNEHPDGALDPAILDVDIFDVDIFAHRVTVLTAAFTEATSNVASALKFLGLMADFAALQ
jgi:hypothetical protein